MSVPINQIESRIINKELETKRILINFILLFSIRLFNKFGKLFLSYLDISINNDLSQIYLLLTRLSNVLFIYNILTGLYKLFKPIDEFKDLDLSANQRKLLGLPQLVKIESLNTSTSTIASLSPKKVKDILSADNNDKSQRVATATTTKKSSTPSPLKKIPQQTSLMTSTPTKLKTPIASPMSSPSPIKIKNNLGPTPKLTNLKKNLNDLSTPSYIPSPKYYYRMDSPSRTRRI